MFTLNRSTKITTSLMIAAGLLVGCGSDDDTPVPQNQPPLAMDDVITIEAHQKLVIDVLENDSDPEGGELTLLSAGMQQGAGAILVEKGKLHFKSDVEGTAQIQYQVADEAGLISKALVKVQVTESEHVLSYVGTATCLNCHDDKATFLNTGHNYKLSKIENSQAPYFPYTTLEGSLEHLSGVTNSLGTPQSWDDISYVIGGFYRTGMFIDKNGYIVDGEKVRAIIPDLPKEHMVFTPEDMGAHNAEKDPDSGIFTCGYCHTTGWRDYTPDSVLSPYKQDNLKGFGGSFVYTGVQCEACHGAGSKHVETGNPEDITKHAKGRFTSDLARDDMGYGMPMACGECHSKETNRHFPDFVSEHNKEFGGDNHGGRSIPYNIGGRVAQDDLMGMDANTGRPIGKKRDMTCYECHNPHQSKIYDDEAGNEGAMVKACRDCHQDIGFMELTANNHEEIDCETCHMPNNRHFFRTNLMHASDSEHNFSDDKAYLQPWNTAKDACSSCHVEDYDDKADLVYKMHN